MILVLIIKKKSYGLNPDYLTVPFRLRGRKLFCFLSCGTYVVLMFDTIDAVPQIKDKDSMTCYFGV